MTTLSVLQGSVLPWFYYLISLLLVLSQKSACLNAHYEGYRQDNENNRTMEKRIKKKPQTFGEWEENINFRHEQRNQEKLWEVEDILDVRGANGDKEYLVKWKDWNGPDTWISAEHNPELQSFVGRNINNPDSCKLNRDILDLPKSDDNMEILSLKQAVFVSLADVRYTPEGSIGHQSRITVKVPISVRKFERFPGTMEMLIVTTQ